MISAAIFDTLVWKIPHCTQMIYKRISEPFLCTGKKPLVMRSIVKQAVDLG